MLIIGCDFHPGLQQVTIFDNQSGEYQEKRLGHRGEAERFLRFAVGAGAGWKRADTIHGSSTCGRKPTPRAG